MCSVNFGADAGVWLVWLMFTVVTPFFLAT